MAAVTTSALIAAAVITGAAVAGSTAYQASEEKKAQKKTLAFQEEQQNKLLSFQEQQVKEAENKVAAAEALSQQEAKDKLRKQRLSQTQTILTSPLGISDEANIGLSTLLGGK